MDVSPLLLSLKLSITTVAILLVVGFPFAALLAFRGFPAKAFLESVVTLPLVLPPTVIGFYLLLLFSPYNFPGKLLKEMFGLQVVYSFSGLVIASCVYSLPFIVEPLKTGLEKLPREFLDASAILGKSKLETFFRVAVPCIRPSIYSAIVMTFAHTMGEFGVVLMIGGNMPGTTKVISIAIYEKVESLSFGQAHIYSTILVGFSLLTLTLLHLIKRKTVREEKND